MVRASPLDAQATEEGRWHPPMGAPTAGTPPGLDPVATADTLALTGHQMTTTTWRREAMPIHKPNQRAAESQPIPGTALARNPPPTLSKVVKKLQPGQPGTLKLMEQFGDKLVCVRHRHDPHDLHRWTTVELIVEHRAIRGGADPYLLVRIGRHEDNLREAVMATGGQWSPTDHLWQVRRSTVRNLGLADRVVRLVRPKR